MKKELTLIFKQLTVCLEATIQARDGAFGNTKSKYRKLAKRLEIALNSLESAINLIGE